MNRIKKKIIRAAGMYQIHGGFPVASFFISKFYPFKLLFRKLSWPWLIRVKIHGSTMYLNAHDPGISTMLLTEGTREEGHVEQVKSHISSGMSGIDLGANIGYYALIEARLVGEKGKVYAIEPEPGNIKLLKRNIKANNFEDRILVSQYLVGDHDGVGKLQMSALSNRHSVSTDGKGDFIEVPMVTLDTFMERNKLEPRDIGFLRMDIEGYEVIVFQGMNKLMSGGTPLKIFIEFHPRWYSRWGWSFERLLDYLESFGFRVRGLTYKGEGEVITLSDPSREEIMATQIIPRTSSGGCHGYLERI